MGTKWTLASLKVVCEEIFCLSKDELPQARGVREMVMWENVPVKSFIFPVLHLQIGLWNYILSNLINLIDSGVEMLSTGEGLARNTLVTVKQVVAKRRQDHQIWDVKDGVML